MPAQSLRRRAFSAYIYPDKELIIISKHNPNSPPLILQLEKFSSGSHSDSLMLRTSSGSYKSMNAQGHISETQFTQTSHSL